MSHLPPEFAISLNESNLLSPMDEVLNAVGKADFIALGRTLVADPEWVNKLARGEEDDETR